MSALELMGSFSMRNRQRSSAVQFACAGLLCCCATAARTAASDDCRALSDDAQRLACYDQVFPRTAIPAQSPKTQPAIVGSATTQPGASPEGGAHESGQQSSAPDPEFGLSEAQRRAGAANTEQAKIRESILATVTDLRQTSGGEFIVTLDNGQVWRQIDLESWSAPQKGDRVRIRRGLLGSFMLVTSKNLATHVRRER